MKAQSTTAQKLPATAQKMSTAEVKEKIRQKFGKDLDAPRPKVETKAAEVELSTKQGVTHSEEEDFGDIGKNNPTSAETQEKLKEILRTGGFQFNDRERKTLAEILK